MLGLPMNGNGGGGGMYGAFRLVAFGQELG